MPSKNGERKKKRSKNREQSQHASHFFQQQFAGARGYGHPREKAGSFTLHTLRPKHSPKFGLNQGGVITFQLQAGVDQFVRIPERPILVKYKLWTRKEASTAAPNATEEAKAKAEATKLRYNKTDYAAKPCLVNPAHGMGIVFSGAEVLLDDFSVTDTVQGNSLHWIHKTMNTIASTSNQRKTDDTNNFIKNKFDRRDKNNSTDSLEGGPAYRRGLSLVMSDSWSTGAPSEQLVGLDGIPFLGRPRFNPLATLHHRNEVNRQGYLMPGQRIEIRLHVRSNLSIVVDECLIPAANYFDVALAGAPDTATLVNGKLEIIEVSLQYEVFRPATDHQRESLTKKHPAYYWDVPHMSTHLLNAGAQRVQQEIFVPSGAKFLCLTYMYGHQIWASESSNRSMSAYFTLPKIISNVSMHLVNHGALIAESLGDVYGLGAHRNVILRNHHQSLVEAGIIDDPFEDVFPPSEEDIQFNQLIMVDLTKYDIQVNTTLRLTTAFENEKACPLNFYAVANFVKEIKTHKTSDGTWRVSY